MIMNPVARELIVSLSLIGMLFVCALIGGLL